MINRAFYKKNKKLLPFVEEIRLLLKISQYFLHKKSAVRRMAALFSTKILMNKDYFFTTFRVMIPSSLTIRSI